jgi:hypothetical protein
MSPNPIANESVSPGEAVGDPSRPFVNRWNKLVSVTNWEKGRIICEWRTTVIAGGGLASENSDEAWAERVGGVTGQHVGRLRRTHERFGQVYQEYPGLYWSHFQASLDWNDAEMWLEGAVQNGWSVSQMRAKRWETLGAPASLKPRDEDIIVAELDEDCISEIGERAAVTPQTAAVRDLGKAAEFARDEDLSDGCERTRGEHGLTDDEAAADANQPAAAKAARFRPFENLPKLPDDVAEAFEQFKLVILTHKLAGWTDIARDDLVACLAALEALALQPADD